MKYGSKVMELPLELNQTILLQNVNLVQKIAIPLWEQSTLDDGGWFDYHTTNNILG
jgi:hypothetical protein